MRDVTLAALRLPDVIAQNVVSLAAPSVRHVEDRGGSIEVDYLMRDVPQTPEEIAALRARVEDDPQLRGMLVTPDQRAALVVLDFWEGPQSYEIAQRVLDLIATVRDRPRRLLRRRRADDGAHRPRAVRARWRSASRSSSWSSRSCCWSSFRNLQGMLIPMLTAVLSTVWALGLMGHTGIVIDAWNVAVPILLIAIAAAHSAQMLKRYVEEVARTGDNRAAVIESTVKMGPVMIAAGLTAALGFASLALFGVRAVANLGLSCAYGIGSAVLLEMTFIPALRAVLPAPAARAATGGGWTARVLASLQRAVLRHNGRAVLIGTAVVLASLAVGILRIRTFGSTREYMPRGQPGAAAPRGDREALPGHGHHDHPLRRRRPAARSRCPCCATWRRSQEEMERIPLVVRTASVADLVKTLHKTFNADDPTPYRLPDNQELVVAAPLPRRLAGLRALRRALAVARGGHAPTCAATTPRWSARSCATSQAGSPTHPAPDGERVLIAGGAGPDRPRGQRAHHVRQAAQHAGGAGRDLRSSRRSSCGRRRSGSTSSRRSSSP